ncbi:MAG: S9 family peptidase, partial [bacterium]|nr:S9 family peptidase [bacterium]
VRDDVDSDWRELVKWDFEEMQNSTSLYINGDGDGIYLMDSRNSNTSRLVEVDIYTGEIEEIGADPEYDLSNVILHPDTRGIQAYSFYKAREEWVVADEDIRADFAALAALDEGDFSLLDRSNDDIKWMVHYDKDNASGSYYVYDRKTKTGDFLFDTRPELNNYKLASMEPITYAARDGLQIEGYATFPPGKERENLPTVLYVHGGPIARDVWGLEPFTQTMANRGYLVLQVNFRGSEGYGKDFIAKSEKEWGGTMQDDLTDAVNWAIEQGWSDPDKLSIMGMSYGGYAALAGATFTPDLYTCAVSAMGPSNLNTFMLTIPPYWKPFEEVMYRRIGNPHTETDFLESRSPIFKVDRIEIPMLLSYGANDPRVNIAEGEQIVAELEAKGIDYEYLVYENEGHGFMQEYNRIHFLANVEKFLAEHLGGRFEPYEE